MTQRSTTGRVQKNLRIKVGEHNYEKQVSSVDWPGTSGLTWRGGTPDAVVTDTANQDEVCNITFIQSPGDEESFWRFCFEHAGEKADVEYQHDASDEVKFTASITILRPQLGGQVNQFNEATVGFPSTPPILAPAVP